MDKIELENSDFTNNVLSASASRSVIWNNFVQWQKGDLLLSVLGQYQLHHHITKEDIFAVYEFKKAQILGRIGYVIYYVDSYAKENTDSKGNQKALNKLSDFEIEVWNASGDISDGEVRIKNKTILNQIPMLYPSDAIIEKKLAKKKKFYKAENKNLETMSLEIGYTSYAKTLCQLFATGAVARFPYQDSTGIISGLHVLYLINDNTSLGMLKKIS